MRQLLDVQDLQLAIDTAPGQVRRTLAAAVEHHDARGRDGRRQARGGRVGDVMRHEAHAGGIEPGQRGLEEERGAAHVQRAQALP
jgi:hypothetical protein